MSGSFWEELRQRLPDAEKLGEVWVSPRDKEYLPYIDAIKKAQPTAVFVCLGTTGMIPFTRQAKSAGLFEKARVFLSGLADPVFPFVLEDEMPTVNAYGSGEFLWYWPQTKEVKQFVSQYNEAARRELGKKILPPGFTAFDGYTAAKFITEAILKAASTDTEAVVNALEGLVVQTPTGSITMRACDHQAAGKINWGRIRVIKGLPLPGLLAPQYLSLAEFLPSCEDVMAVRRKAEERDR
jgi:branched-chain amino acid transport system substrate-binding protein